MYKYYKADTMKKESLTFMMQKIKLAVESAAQDGDL